MSDADQRLFLEARDDMLLADSAEEEARRVIEVEQHPAFVWVGIAISRRLSAITKLLARGDLND